MSWWAIIGVVVVVVAFAAIGAADIVNRECKTNEEDH